MLFHAPLDVADFIVQWLQAYARGAGCNGYVCGVSGGVDSAAVSTLCARTTLPVLCVSLPLRQEAGQHTRATEHLKWLRTHFTNVDTADLHLDELFGMFERTIPDALHPLNAANARSRLRMTMLYALAGERRALVCGTGNRVEDFGVGFFTKYGDGGVDVSPIADLYKSQVRQVAEALGVSQDIVTAAPTDGLWDDGRTDEDQLGVTYDELEWAMEELANPSGVELNTAQQDVLAKYRTLHQAAQHKMHAPPVCHIPADLRTRIHSC